MAKEEGKDLAWVLEEFKKSIRETKVGVGHNIDFDYKIVGAEFLEKKSKIIFKKFLKQIPWNWELILCFARRKRRKI